MNKTIAASLLVCASAFGSDYVAGYTPPKSGEPQTCTPKPKDCEKAPANLCDPIQVCEVYDNKGINLGFRADLLYMNYSTPIYTFATQAHVVDAKYTSTIYDVKSDGSLGCDLALTYTLPKDPGYSFEGGWYHIVTTFKHDISTDSLFPAHVAGIDSLAPGTATNNGALAINFFDLFMSKSYQFGSPFTIAPAVGVIGGYMDSHNTSKFYASSGTFLVDETLTFIDLRQVIDFKGIGVKVGTSYKFDFCWGFKLTGNLYYNALYGFSKSDLYTDINALYDAGSGIGSFSSSDSHYTHHHGRSFIDSLVCLAWQKSYWKNTMFFDVHVGWRVQAYPSGWAQFEAEFNDSEHDLYLFGQGLDAGIAFKF